MDEWTAESADLEALAERLHFPEDVRREFRLPAADADVRVLEVCRDLAKASEPVPFEMVKSVADFVVDTTAKLFDAFADSCLRFPKPASAFAPQVAEIRRVMIIYTGDQWRTLTSGLVMLDEHGHRFQDDGSLEHDHVEKLTFDHMSEYIGMANDYTPGVDFDDIDPLHGSRNAGRRGKTTREVSVLESNRADH